MIVNGKIIEAEMRMHKGKEVCGLSIRLTEPEQLVAVTIWNNAVIKGEHKPFVEVAGEWIQFALREPEIFGGRVSYNINTAFKPVKIGKTGTPPKSATA